MGKADVKKSQLIGWNELEGKPPEVALAEIYKHAEEFSKSAREWYWTSIPSRRQGSTVMRVAGFTLGLAGVIAPVLAAIWGDAAEKLTITQLGVAALVTAGLTQLCDKVFGWSSGWLRYVRTVTAMEKLTLDFELGWMNHFVAHRGTLSDDDTEALFALAQQLELEIEKRRSEETDLWINEFNSGMAALDEMIKIQKEAARAAAEKAQTVVTAQSAARKNGAIQINVQQPGNPPCPVTITFDDCPPETFTGPSWAKLDVEPGTHSWVVVLRDGTKDGRTAKMAKEVPAGAVAVVDVKF